MYNIIFSLTAHENIDCLYDLIDNIKKAFVNYNITILISIPKRLNDIFDRKYHFVKIVTIRDNNYELWGNINLFNEHILIMEYMFKNNLDCDYFWFVASNEMFIKPVPEYFIEKYSLKIFNNKDTIKDTEYELYYNNLINKKHSWFWIESMKKDTHILNYFYKNKFIIIGRQHEGIVLPFNLVLEVFNEYKCNKLYESATYKDYVMEEIFMSTYILNKYNINNLNAFCFRYIYTLGENAEYNKIKDNLNEYHLSIKPVKREYNDITRTIIRNNL